MIDFHCHLDLFPDPEAVLQRVVASGHYVLAVTTTPKAWHGTCNLVGNAPRVRVALGLHPELIGERFGEVELLCSLLDETDYVGEVGLDGSPQYRATFGNQVEAFRTILQACAARGGKILSIHSRGAASTVLDILDDIPSAGTAVLHWFSGSPADLRRAVRLGCWFSVGPPMLRSAKGRKLVAQMPIDRVLTETDGPFTRKAGAPLFPSDVVDAIDRLSEFWSCSPAAVQRRINGNLRALVSLRRPAATACASGISGRPANARLVAAGSP